MMSSRFFIFVSYSWADAVLAQGIPGVLRSVGLQPWIDFERLDLDYPLQPQLDEAISMVDCMLLLDSANARLSRWVQLELQLASKMKKPIVPLPIEDGIARRCSRRATRLTVRTLVKMERKLGTVTD